MNEKYIQSLRNAIQTQHGCISRYVQTVAVKGVTPLNGWQGNVEIFDLAGHAKARQCFAWGFRDEAGRWQYLATLKISPIDSAEKAVKNASTAAK